MTQITLELCEGLRNLTGAIPRTLPRRVLVVDDDKQDATILKRALDDIGCSAEIATSGDMAIELVKSARPFTRIFLDLAFPVGRNGVETLSEVRQLAPLTPVTIVTGHFSEELLSAAKALQYDVIDKFVDTEKLKQAVVKAMG